MRQCDVEFGQNVLCYAVVGGGHAYMGTVVGIGCICEEGDGRAGEMGGGGRTISFCWRAHLDGRLRRRGIW